MTQEQQGSSPFNAANEKHGDIDAYRGGLDGVSADTIVEHYGGYRKLLEKLADQSEPIEDREKLLRNVLHEVGIDIAKEINLALKGELGDDENRKILANLDPDLMPGDQEDSSDNDEA